MSFFLTMPQIRARTKTVTRRDGWTFLKPGDRFWAVVKGQGLKKGEKVERICQLECVSNRREPLSEMTHDDAEPEGFPEMPAEAFVDMYCQHNGGPRDKEISRIEFKYV